MLKRWFISRRRMFTGGAQGALVLLLSRFPWLRDHASALDLDDLELDDLELELELDLSDASKRFVAISAHPSDLGIWLLSGRGEVVSMGDAAEFDAPAIPSPPFRLARFTAMAATPSGGGLWLLTQRGDVISLGDALEFDAPAIPSPPFRLAPFTAMAATASGAGLWLLTQRGDVISLGDALEFDEPAIPSPPFRLTRFTGIAATPSGSGLWLLTAREDVVSLGDAPNFAEREQSSLTLSCPPSENTDGIVVEGSLTPGVDGSQVVLTYRRPSSDLPVMHTVQTNATGDFQDEMPREVGDWSIRAHFDGDATRTSADAAPCSFTLSPPP